MRAKYTRFHVAKAMEKAGEVPGQVLAMQDIGWALLFCSTKGPYVYNYKEHKIEPLGGDDEG